MKFFEIQKIKNAWKNLNLIPIRMPSSVETYLHKLACHYQNGAIYFLHFKTDNCNELSDLFSHDNWIYSKIHEEIWIHPTISNLLPKLNNIKIDKNTFEYSNYFELTSLLASILHNGGAYTSLDHRINREICFNLAFDVAKDILPNNSNDPNEEIILINVNIPWCDFFYDIAWDYSIITFCKVAKLFSVFLITDTD